MIRINLWVKFLLVLGDVPVRFLATYHPYAEKQDLPKENNSLRINCAMRPSLISTDRLFLGKTSYMHLWYFVSKQLDFTTLRSDSLSAKITIYPGLLNNGLLGEITPVYQQFCNNFKNSTISLSTHLYSTLMLKDVYIRMIKFSINLIPRQVVIEELLSQDSISDKTIPKIGHNLGVTFIQSIYISITITAFEVSGTEKFPAVEQESVYYSKTYGQTQPTDQEHSTSKEDYRYATCPLSGKAISVTKYAFFKFIYCRYVPPSVF